MSHALETKSSKMKPHDLQKNRIDAECVNVMCDFSFDFLHRAVAMARHQMIIHHA
jgi:hypothetical protein